MPRLGIRPAPAGQIRQLTLKLALRARWGGENGPDNLGG